MKPLVSIVMPVYNGETYLRETLDSIANQSYRNFEVICVDDGSTDCSLNILQEYCEKDSRFTILQQKNQFAGVARNNGMKVATGKYILFLDSDDLFKKHMLSILVKEAEKKYTDIIYFGFYHFTENLRRCSMMGIPFSSRRVCSPEEHKEDLFRIAQGVPWNKFFRRDFVVRTGLQFQDLQSNNDVFFSKMIALEAKRILFLNRRFIYYRVSNGDSLQGSYKLSSGNFAKCIMAIYNEMKAREYYEDYRDSFENYVVDSYMLIFHKCQTKQSFELVCDIMKQSLEDMEITTDTLAISSHPASGVFEMILRGDKSQALFELWKFLRSTTVSQGAIECRIGRKMLSILRIKYY